jgi:hypothetical protein
MSKDTGVITSRELDRGNALTGVARIQHEAQVRRELESIQQERQLERALNDEIEKQMKAKSKRTKSGKKNKK